MHREGNSAPAEKCVCIVGPTASGKSEVALLLAEKLGGEIISVDSMQVYRGLNIGTAKPGPSELARAPHHLIDIAGLNETFDAAQFARLASHAAEEIRARGHVPIFCGGTGLYFKAVFEGLGESPPADKALRSALEQSPLATLLTELEQADPATFAKIDRQNPRRVIRALEVIRLTGRPYSAQRTDWRSSGTSAAPFFGLSRQSADLHARINARVDQMFQRGLVEEVRQLLGNGLEENRTAMQAIGYCQVAEHLRAGRPLAETIELVKIRTRQYAKRQMTWFRRHAQVEWLPVERTESAESVAQQITSALLKLG